MSLPFLEGLDAEVDVDPRRCGRGALDFGRLVRTVPRAIVRPRSKAAVCELVAACAREGVPLSARGQGHSGFGQSQSAGVVVDMSTLSRIHAIGDGFARVDAGCTWTAILDAALSGAAPQAPPVITGYSRLSVGGTLSVGGMSGMAFAAGPQVQHVTELEVVTGEGRVVTCSEAQERRLFEAVLAGQGQCGIILEATLALAPAKPRTREYTIMYRSAAELLEAMEALLDAAVAGGGRALDVVWGAAVQTPSGWMFPLIANAHYAPGEEPDPSALFAPIRLPQPPVEDDLSYRGYFDKLDRQVSAIATGPDRYPLWLDVFLPAAATAGYVAQALGEARPDDYGQGGVCLLFPLDRRASTRPLLRLPEGARSYLFDYCRNTDPIPRPKAEELLARNKALYARALGLGGTIYPIGAMRMSAEEHRAHYGDAFERFAEDKRAYDPRGILGTGVPIFGA